MPTTVRTMSASSRESRTKRGNATPIVRESGRKGVQLGATFL